MESRQRPLNRSPVMYQRWRDLLFLHWKFDPAELQRTLPTGLTIDTYQGDAYLGVVPFFMQDVRPRFCPVVPGISNFLELNLRTYVFDRHGRPGVWFYSLDANQWLAVRLARMLFNLPYFDAQLRARRKQGINYECHRLGSDSCFDSSFFYSPLQQLETPKPDSLEFFLIERYLLFSTDRSGALFIGKVHHEPYTLNEVRLEIIKEGTIGLAGFHRPKELPDHIVMSHGVDVEIFAIERVRD